MYDIQKRIHEESLLAVPIFTDIKGNDCNRHKRADWVDGCNCGVGIMFEMIQHMKDNGLEVVITNTDSIDVSEWDDSHELNNVMNQMVDDVFPELTLSKPISILDKWEKIDFGTDLYELVLDRTQEMKPIDYGSTLDYRYATYEFDEIIYELSWDILLTNSRPIIKRKCI